MSKKKGAGQGPGRVILEAAFAAFQRYGYRRTAMRDIAEIANVSRPALYLHYANKADIFVAVAKMLRDDVLAAVEDSWPEGADVTAGLSGALLAKELSLFRLLHESEHGAEMRAVDQQLTAAIAAELETAFSQFLIRRLRSAQKAGAVAPGFSARDLNALAGFVARAAAGLKGEAKSAPVLEADLGRLAEIVAVRLEIRQ